VLLPSVLINTLASGDPEGALTIRREGTNGGEPREAKTKDTTDLIDEGHVGRVGQTLRRMSNEDESQMRLLRTESLLCGKGGELDGLPGHKAR
jgi:hypothetical protein